MPTGIYIRTELTRKILSLAHKGQKLSKEHRKKISESNKGHPVSEETKQKISKSNKGRRRTLEQRKRMSKSHKGKHHSEEVKRKIGLGNEGKILSKWHISRIIKYNTGKHLSEETKEKIRQARAKQLNPNKGRHFSKETRRRQSFICKANWRKPEYRNKQIKAIIKGHSTRYACPTKPERRLRNRLNKLFPKEYRFVGDGSVILGGKCPDFVNINGQKKIIELFGDYWHSKKVTGLSKRKHSQERIRHFVKYGYETLIVWEYELKNMSKLKKKLVEFNNA